MSNGLNNGSTRDRLTEIADDSDLLMHFLDNVFPVQYPMYKPKEGRGWLLTFLLKAKPFYHASLALSASHQRTVLPPGSSQSAILLQEQQHLEACLKMIRLGAEHQCANGGTAMLAAVIQVMFLDVRRSLRIIIAI
jgi:hypothetical protein